MRIAQVAPLHESVPPKLYGGTERVVSYLTEELCRLGHQVTLYASGDSSTAARLKPACPAALRLDARVEDPLAHHMILLDHVLADAEQYDIVHFHLDYIHFPLARLLGVPHLTTMHGRLDLPDLRPLFDRFHDLPVVSISNAQRRPLPRANWQATVYNGLPEGLHRFHPEPGTYLAFLGRISPEKGIVQAIDIAGRAGMELRVAAKIDAADRSYYEEVVRPLLRQPHVTFVGEIDEQQKNRFLGEAAALLFPIDWPEPFGMVMIEALACGTPVIAFGRGSVPEVLAHGACGFVVETADEAVQAVGRLGELSRWQCRRYFEQRFSARRMAEDYLAVYERLLASRRQPRLAA